MKELNTVEINEISGGDWATGVGLVLGFAGAFNALTSFGSGLGRGLYDGFHTQSMR